MADDGSAVRRPRAGTMPSTFHLNNPVPSTSAAGSRGVSPHGSVRIDPLANPTDPLLAAAAPASSFATSARPDLLLHRRKSGLPLTGPSAGSGSSSSHFLGVGGPGSGSGSAGSLLNYSSSSLGGVAVPNSMAASSSSMTNMDDLRASILRASQPLTPDPAAAARLRSGSLTVPSPTLASVGLTASASHSGHSTTMSAAPGPVFGPPGSGAWSPIPSSAAASSSMSSLQTSAPLLSVHSAQDASDRPRRLSSGLARHAHTRQPSDIDPSHTLGGILDLLDSDDTPTSTTIPDSPFGAKYSLNQSLTPQGPLSVQATTTLFPPPGILRRSSGSVSVPPSTQPSMQNLRQAYLDQSSISASSSSSHLPSLLHLLPTAPASAPMHHTLSAGTGSNLSVFQHYQQGVMSGMMPSTSVPSLSAVSAATRLRASTLSTADMFGRSSYRLASSSAAHAGLNGTTNDLLPIPSSNGLRHASFSVGESGRVSPSRFEGIVPHEAPSRSLADLQLCESADVSSSLRDPAMSAASSAYLLNRPRATTIAIVDAAIPPGMGSAPTLQADTFEQAESAVASSLSAAAVMSAAQHRKRAGTSIDVGLGRPSGIQSAAPRGPSGLRTPLYDVRADGYPQDQDLVDSDKKTSDLVTQAALDAENTGRIPAITSYAQAVAGVSTPTLPKADFSLPVMSPERPTTPPARKSPTIPLSAASMQKSRSLWVGNVDARITSHDLYTAFSPYGAIESIRVLPDRECGFINFVSATDALAAKDDILNRLEGQIQTQSSGALTIRIGYGKTENVPNTPASSLHSRNFSNLQTPTAPLMSAAPSTDGPVQSSPTRALWIGSVPPTLQSTDLVKVFSAFGAIESARILPHKQCGFCNFESIEDAVRARDALNGQEILGSEVGPVKIGFAKVPGKTPGSEITSPSAYAIAKHSNGNHASDDSGAYRTSLALANAANAPGRAGLLSTARLARVLQPAVGLSPSLVASEFGDSVASPLLGTDVPDVDEQRALMRELSGDSADAESHVELLEESLRATNVYLTIPPIPEDRQRQRNPNLDTPRMRDIRKRLEAPAQHVSQAEVDGLTSELLEDTVYLSTDYIGNCIVQRMFERCSSELRLAILQQIAPHLATISCHKNGTWASQKIIDTACSIQEVTLICQNIRPYVPSLLLDQFGNYAAQLCLRFFSPNSDFLFDAMVDRCWEIGTGRFGARSIRTCLESSNATKYQQKRVAIAIILNSVPLAANSNGSLLLTWLLDTSNLPGRYSLLASRFTPHLAQLCAHKVASTTILKVINQKVDLQSSRHLANAVLTGGESTVLEDILGEQVHGSSFIHKLLASPYLDTELRQIGVGNVRKILQRNPSHHSPAYGKLCLEVGLPAPISTQPSFNGQHHPGMHNTYQRHTPSLQYSKMNAPVTPGPATMPNPKLNTNSPAFTFPQFGSPLSPQPHPVSAAAAIANTAGRSGSRDNPSFQEAANLFYSQKHDPYIHDGAYNNGPMSDQQREPSPRSAPLMPSLAAGGLQHNNYADQYLQNVAALQMSGFTGLSPYAAYGQNTYNHSLGHHEYNPSPIYPFYEQQSMQARPS